MAPSRYKYRIMIAWQEAVHPLDTMRTPEQYKGKCESKKDKINDHCRRLVTNEKTKAYFLGFWMILKSLSFSAMIVYFGGGLFLSAGK